MKSMQKLAALLLLVLMTGCATLPTGPSVNVLPAEGKPFDEFQADDAECRKWAERQLGMPVQETYDRNVATGAVAGTAVGAGIGAALGSASGHAGTGALIGAASGLLVGASAGSSSGQVYGREAQRRYDNAYVQCMYSYGNQTPGQSQVASQPVPAAVAPPPPEAVPEYETYPSMPEFYVDEAPRFIFSPTLNMYVAVGVSYDLLYTGNEYYYFVDGRWYRGPYYNGPWEYVPRRAYPPVFLRYRVGDFRHFRDQEYRRYEHDGARYNGRFHRPEFRGERRR